MWGVLGWGRFGGRLGGVRTKVKRQLGVPTQVAMVAMGGEGEGKGVRIETVEAGAGAEATATGVVMPFIEAGYILEM